jgi:NADPH:quinone reductase
MAEFVCANFDKCYKIPDSMDFNSAAGFFITYGTSYHALKQRASLKAGETLLVLGAAGGVGLAAVELGVAMGAKVIAACSSQEKLDIAIKHGASSGIVYPLGPFDGAGKKELSGLFKNACGPNGVDVIYDAIGGDYSEASFRSIAWNGRFLVVGFPSGIPTIPLNLPLLKSGNIMGVFWGAFTEREKEENAKNISELMAFYSEGKVKPFISKVFGFNEGADAIAHLASRKAVGKVIVSVP